MSLKTLFLSAATPVLLLASITPAQAQTACPNEITGEETRTVQTSNENNGEACDVTIASGGQITTTSGSAVIVDSSNNVTHAGQIISSNADNTTGIEVQGGNTGSILVSGSINLSEDTTQEDTDNDRTVDGPFAEGSGRTGILISGASPFVGDVTTELSSNISVRGNDSYAFRLMETAGLTGNLNLGGTIQLVGGVANGSASRAVVVEGDVTGDINHSGAISVQGEGGSGIVLAGDLTGGVTNTGSISNTGYRFTNRQTVLSIPDAIDATDSLQAGSAIQISGNVTEGVYLQRDPITDDNGTITSFDGNSQIVQFGSAPAILFDGQGTNISIGTVVPITNTTDSQLQFAFVNQGTVSSNGIFDDVSATTVAVRDTTLQNGINNAGTLTADTFRSSSAGTADTALSRVVVLGSGAIATQIQNTGLIRAAVSENTSEIYADLDNPLPPQSINAVAIDVDANASLTTIVNTGIIQAALTGRDGTAIAIRDASGTITIINNNGSILATGANSDPRNDAATNFTTIALDLSANSSGVTINQTEGTATPTIFGDVLLGSGDDNVNIAAGNVIGDLALDAGANSLSLSGNSSYVGTITNSGGLVISVSDGGTLSQSTATPINATSASFDATSTFRPTIDGVSGIASTLNTTGDITFADGAGISPTLASIIDPNDNTFTVLNAGGALNLGGSLETLLAFDSPFLYDSTFQVDPNNPNALLVTFDLRPVAELGLDGVQAASFDTAFGAMAANPVLAQAFLGITDGGEFQSSLSQLLPEFAAAARHFVVANVDGAVGAVGSHLDNARRSQEKPGGAWIQEFTYFADRDLAGLSEQYRGFGFGFTGGVDSAFGPFHTAGVNFGFASTEIEDVVGFDDPMDVMTYQAGLYAGLESGGFSLDLYGGGGANDFEQTRNVEIGTFAESAQSEWSGTHINGSVRGGYDIALGKKFWMRPAFSVDYLRLKEKGYSETSTLDNPSIALDVDGRTSELAGATGMLNFGANFQGRRTWLRPSIRAGYRNEFVNDGVSTTYGFSGLDRRANLVSDPFPEDGFLLGFSVAAGSGYSSFGFDFDSDIRDGFVRHTGRIVLRMIF